MKRPEGPGNAEGAGIYATPHLPANTNQQPAINQRSTFHKDFCNYCNPPIVLDSGNHTARDQAVDRKAEDSMFPKFDKKTHEPGQIPNHRGLLKPINADQLERTASMKGVDPILLLALPTCPRQQEAIPGTI